MRQTASFPSAAEEIAAEAKTTAAAADAAAAEALKNVKK